MLHLVSASRPWDRGGFAIRTHDVARAQVGAGLEVHVATPPGFPGKGHGGAGEVPYEGIPYHRLSPMASRRQPADARIQRCANELAALAGTLRPAALQVAENAALSESTAQAALAVGRSMDIPVVVEVRGFREEASIGEPAQHRTRALSPSPRDGCGGVVRGGRGGHARPRDAPRVERRGVLQPYPGHSQRSEYRPVHSAAKGPSLATAIGIGPGDIVIGYVGSLTWYEDLPALVRAIHALVGVVGRCGSSSSAMGPRRQISGQPRMRLGSATDCCSLVMCPTSGSRTSNGSSTSSSWLAEISRLTRLVTPIKPIEALAVGCALVVNDLPALEELVIDGVTGRIVPAGDQDALIDVLDALVQDPGARRRLGTAGAAWVREHRSWAANGERYRDLFAELGVT